MLITAVCEVLAVPQAASADPGIVLRVGTGGAAVNQRIVSRVRFGDLFFCGTRHVTGGLHLRVILDRMASARRTFGCGVEVLKSFRRGNVDYAVIPHLSGVDLEQFRKPQVAVTRINVLEAGYEVPPSALVRF